MIIDRLSYLLLFVNYKSQAASLTHVQSPASVVLRVVVPFEIFSDAEECASIIRHGSRWLDSTFNDTFTTGGPIE